MRHQINKTKFGLIQIEGITYNHDVIIGLDGVVMKRKKKFSKAIYGTSHKVSLDEAQYIYEKGAELFFQEKGIKVEISSTPEAIQLWNNTKGKAIGLFHVTC